MGSLAHGFEPGGSESPDAGRDPDVNADVTVGMGVEPEADSPASGPVSGRVGVVAFEPDLFRSQHPEFEDLTDDLLNVHFQTAEILLSGTPARNSPDRGLSLGMRSTLLYALVCHLATLARQKSGPSGPVTGATMGSISLSFGRPASDPDPFLSWLEQTSCGAFAALLLRRLPRPGPCLVRARRR